MKSSSASGKVTTLLVLVCAIQLFGEACEPESRVSALERRVDSLAVTLGSVVSQLNQRGAAPSETTTVSIAGAIGQGKSSAPVEIVEFTDFQCPFCRRHATTTLPALESQYIKTGKVRYLVRNLPLKSIHPMALTTAEWSRCVAALDSTKYWAFHDAVFKRQSELSRNLLGHLVRNVGLDSGAVASCTRRTAVQAAIDSDLAQAREAGFNSTPVFVIGLSNGSGTVSGVVIPGAYPLQTFQATIDSLLRSTDRAAAKPQ